MTPGRTSRARPTADSREGARYCSDAVCVPGAYSRSCRCEYVSVSPLARRTRAEHTPAPNRAESSVSQSLRAWYQSCGGPNLSTTALRPAEVGPRAKAAALSKAKNPPPGRDPLDRNALGAAWSASCITKGHSCVPKVIRRSRLIHGDYTVARGCARPAHSWRSPLAAVNGSGRTR